MEIRGTAWVSFFYPFGYYTLLAGWIALIRLVTPSLVVTFFGARLFSVILLTVGLILVYRTARGLRLPAGLGAGLDGGRWLVPAHLVRGIVRPA